MVDTKILLRIAKEDNFSLADTLNCGQCFRWDEAEDGSFEGVVEGVFCRARQTAEGIAVDSDGSEQFWSNYFDIATSYAAVREQLCTDATLAQAAAFAPGIRVLRQYPWETLCSFIISQNNNIKRIRGIVTRLCESFGEKLPCGKYSFPTAGQLAGLSIDELAPLRSGFRAKYIIDAANKVASGEVNLDDVAKQPLEEARKTLQTIIGVGPKVAECALLYGFGRMECFPLDVWMKRAMKELFPAGLPQCANEYAGIAQQYIFNYARLSGKIL
ncbi:MAG: DNA glycosylase [Hydrogenoanaerobacterium sp.]